MPKRHVDHLYSGSSGDSASDFARVRLRLLEPEDLPTTLAWRNREDVRQWFFDDRVLSLDHHRAWFQQYRERDDDFVFVVEQAEPPSYRPVGQVSLYRIDAARHEAEFGRMMIPDPHDRRRGLALAASLLLLHAAFSQWGLSRVHLDVYADNLAALRLWSRCGFAIVSRDDRACRMTVTPHTLAPLPSRLS